MGLFKGKFSGVESNTHFYSNKGDFKNLFKLFVFCRLFQYNHNKPQK